MRAPEFWYPRDGGTPWQARILAPLGGLYGLAGRVRRAFIRPQTAGVPVICIGNLTAGGAGKTPVVIALLHQLRAMGATPFALTRGYGGALSGPVRVDSGQHSAADVGDEALLLAAHAPTIVARDRAAGAQAAVDAGADVIVMDDGFQNPGLVKTLSFVVVDGEAQFGNGHLIPAGPLREPVAEGLARADAVIVMGPAQALPDSRGRPVLRGRVVPAVPLAALAGRRLFAFAGIGRPEKFFAMLRQEGLSLAGTQGFPDHHPYTEGDLDMLAAQARAQDAQLITTEKDFMRLAPERRAGILVVPVHATIEEATLLAGLLARAIQETRP